jgi:hypothetical protein
MAGQWVSSLFAAELAQMVPCKADRLGAREVDVVASQQMGDFASELLGEFIVGFQARYLGHRHDGGSKVEVEVEVSRKSTFDVRRGGGLPARRMVSAGC